MKTTLTVDIDYDPDITDPESLASAADRLLKTILSTPGIMDEYANPRFGEFFIACSTGPQFQPTVIVEISGGVLQEAYASNPAIQLRLVDWDTENCTPGEDNGIVAITDEHGRSRIALVTEFPTVPIDQIAEDTEKALQAAGIDVTGKRNGDLQESRRWVLYDFDADALLGTKVYCEYDEAVEDAARANDILVLPLVIQSIVM